MHRLRSGLVAGVFCLIFSFCLGFSQDTQPQTPSEATKSVQEQGHSDQARKTFPGSTLTRQEIEEFLRNARVIQVKSISTGITGTQRATLDDGKLRHDAHIQTVDISKTSFQTARGTELNFRDCYKFNMAAYELDRLLELDMVPPSVERKVGGHMAAVTWWIDDSMMELERTKKKIEPPNLLLWNQQMYLCRVFDQLIYNTDDNLGNVLITKDWKIWLIDHTRSFRLMKNLENSKNLVQCDRKLLTKLREMNKEALQ
jgi:hypothetical protein